MLVTDKRCWTEINLSAIINNYRIYKNCLPAKTKVMAVVKADAYGHGDVDVASVLQEEGAKDFAVATIDEAIKLRLAGIKGQIFVLGYTPILRAEELAEEERDPDLRRNLREMAAVNRKLVTAPPETAMSPLPSMPPKM